MEVLSQELLNRRTLFSFQVDAGQLNTVLSTIIAAVQKLQQTQALIVQKTETVEAATSDLAQRVHQLEAAVPGMNVDDMRLLRQHLIEVAKAVDLINERDLPDLRQFRQEAATALAANERSIQAITGMGAVGREVDELRREMQRLNSTADGLRDSHSKIFSQLQADRAEHDSRERARESDQQQRDDVLRDLSAKLDRVERDVLPQLAGGIDDLSRRTDENFKEVELSAKAVDGELNKLHADVSNVRAELNSIDNDARHRLGKIIDDMDSKFNIVLQLLQQIEKNSTLMELHVSEAGRVLTNPRDPSVASESGSVRRTPMSAASPGLRNY